MIDFAYTLTELRLEYNITRLRLSEILDVPPAVIDEWEEGKTQPSYEMIANLSRFFNVPAEHFLFE